MKRPFSILLHLLILLALSACGIIPTSPSPMPSPTVTPMPSGLVIDPDAITRIDARLAQMTRDGTFTGSVLIAHEGSVLFSKGYGVADRAQGILNTVQTRFRIGSITKQFTAMAILILQFQGKLNVQDPICNYIANCPEAWRDITIHHLLTHISGLSGRLWPFMVESASLPVTSSQPVELLTLFPDVSLDSLPGEHFAHSNPGYVLLAHIIEQVSGQSYSGYLNQAIFAPLEMRNTGSQDSSSRAAEIYMDSDTTTGVQYGSPPISEGSGHLYSTAEDLFLWDQALYTDQLLPRTELDRVFDPFVHQTEYPGFGYGYGWFVGEFQGHSAVVGAGGGTVFVTLIIRYRQYHLTVIVLTNQANIDYFYIWGLISDELLGTK